MFRKSNLKRGAAVCAVSLLTAVGAFAYWTNGGSGTGNAGTGTTTGITVTQTSTITGLYPGGPVQALAGKFNNLNAGSVFVNQVTATFGSIPGGPLVDGAHPCTAADYQLNGFPVTVGAQVPSGSAQGNWSGASIQMLNTGTNQDGCKDGAVNLVYTSN